MLAKKVMLVALLVMAFLMVSCTQAPFGELLKPIGSDEVVDEESSFRVKTQEEVDAIKATLQSLYERAYVNGEEIDWSNVQVEGELSSRMVVAGWWKIFVDNILHYIHPPTDHMIKNYHPDNRKIYIVEEGEKEEKIVNVSPQYFPAAEWGWQGNLEYIWYEGELIYPNSF